MVESSPCFHAPGRAPALQSDDEGLDWCIYTGSCKSKGRTGQEDQILSPGDKSQENDKLKVQHPGARGKRESS